MKPTPSFQISFAGSVEHVLGTVRKYIESGNYVGVQSDLKEGCCDITVRPAPHDGVSVASMNLKTGDVHQIPTFDGSLF